MGFLFSRERADNIPHSHLVAFAARILSAGLAAADVQHDTFACLLRPKGRAHDCNYKEGTATAATDRKCNAGLRNFQPLSGVLASHTSRAFHHMPHDNSQGFPNIPWFLSIALKYELICGDLRPTRKKRFALRCCWHQPWYLPTRHDVSSNRYRLLKFCWQSTAT
ncbi:hypothetical protein BC830DRAFT_1140422 [Chytriomyces sp. MP71]|nr:hypothetical protein BC830DRAFT_1140422 [Chytriomyces sp. MP71]